MTSTTSARFGAHDLPADTPQATLIALKAAGIDEQAWLDLLARTQVSAVLTAHPTEVQRQSILDCERQIARTLAKRNEARRCERGALNRGATLFASRLIAASAGSDTRSPVSAPEQATFSAVMPGSAVR